MVSELQSSRELSLEQVEADIRLCEEFLSRERQVEGASPGQAQVSSSFVETTTVEFTEHATHEDTSYSPSTTQEQYDMNEWAAAPHNPPGDIPASGVGPEGRRLTEDRRSEILKRLEAERQTRRAQAMASVPAKGPARGSPAGGGHSPTAGDAQKRAERVRQLLEERRGGGRGGGGGGQGHSPPGGGGHGGEGLLSPPSTAAHSVADVGSVRSVYTGQMSAVSIGGIDAGDWQRGAGQASAGAGHQRAGSFSFAAAGGGRRGEAAGGQRHSASPVGSEGTMGAPGGRMGRTPASATGGRAAQRRPMSAPRERPVPKTTRVEEFNLTGTKGKASKSRVVQEMERDMSKHLTFKPKINKKRPESAGATSRVQEVRGDERIQQLATPRTYDKYVGARRARDEEALAECTFKPSVGRAPESRPMAAVPAERRLTADWEHRYLVRERAKVELERQQLSECTFRPNIGNANKFVDPAKYRPIHERVGDLQRQKNELLTRARVEHESSNPDLTFAPRVNPTSARLAEDRQEAKKPLVERLSQSAGERAASAARRRRSGGGAANLEAEGLTFQPAISESSRRLAEERPGRKSEFLARQEEELQRKEQHRQALLQREMEADGCTFAPHIGNSAQVLAQSRRHMRVIETPEERFERMTYKEKEEMEASRAQLQNSYYGQYTFQPTINPTSKKISRPTPVEEMVRNERNSAVKDRVAREAEEEFKRECTFKPSINRKSSTAGYPVATLRVADAINDPDGLMSRIDDYQKEKEARWQRQRDEREYNELKECTFTPEVNPKEAGGALRDRGPVIVRGLGRHMELQELAKRQKEEQRARESKLFWERPVGAQGQYTVPEPFKLSYSDGHSAAVRARVEAEVEAERAQECTFQPRTNEAFNRELLLRILDEHTAEP